MKKLNMDTIGELITIFKASREDKWGEDYKKTEVIAALEQAEDEKVLPFFLEVLSDENEYDLARVDIAKILELRESKTHEEHERIAEVLIKVLGTSEDVLVKQYTAMAAENYIDANGMFEALARTVFDVKEDINVRYNALGAIVREGPTARTAKLMRKLLNDGVFNRTASRLIREWQISED